MTATDFKTTLTIIKDFLKGKTIEVYFIEQDSIKVIKYNSLKSFGNAVLEFEKMGASFGLRTLGNDLCERATIKIETLLKKIDTGNWNRITFIATTLKY